jgi:hypothetical protein
MDDPRGLKALLGRDLSLSDRAAWIGYHQYPQPSIRFGFETRIRHLLVWIRGWFMNMQYKFAGQVVWGV